MGVMNRPRPSRRAVRSYMGAATCTGTISSQRARLRSSHSPSRRSTGSVGSLMSLRCGDGGLDRLLHALVGLGCGDQVAVGVGLRAVGERLLVVAERLLQCCIVGRAGSGVSVGFAAGLTTRLAAVALERVLGAVVTRIGAGVSPEDLVKGGIQGVFEGHLITERHENLAQQRVARLTRGGD